MFDGLAEAEFAFGRGLGVAQGGDVAQSAGELVENFGLGIGAHFGAALQDGGGPIGKHGAEFVFERIAVLTGALEKPAQGFAVCGQNRSEEPVEGRRGVFGVETEKAEGFAGPFHAVRAEVPTEAAGAGERLHLVESALQTRQADGEFLLGRDIDAEGESFADLVRCVEYGMVPPPHPADAAIRQHNTVLDGVDRMAPRELAEVAQRVTAVGRRDEIEIICADEFVAGFPEHPAVGGIDLEQGPVRGPGAGRFLVPVEQALAPGGFAVARG